MRNGLHSPALRGMVERIAEMNSLAEQSAGFVWRFRSPEGFGYLQPLEDYFVPFQPERIFYNLSVWESVESLRDYVFHSRHREVFRQKNQWMAPMDKPHLVMWWVPAGEIPTVAESARRLKMLQVNGATRETFGF